jgi:glycosyltransferase involved in cell wall biosynthesis
MKSPSPSFHRNDLSEPSLVRLMSELLEPDWYQAHYPDIAAGDLKPLDHFLRYGAQEKRNPNRFFDSAWYVEHNPDVAASGLNPLLHYLRAGAAELRNPHPRFDAPYYAEQHPEAAANPLLYHLKTGAARGYLTEKPIDIHDYLPSDNQPSPLPLPRGVFADVVIVVHRDFEATQKCICSVLADRTFPLARIIVIDDRSPEPNLSALLRELAAEGQIYLIRNRRHLGVAASANIGIKAAERHDVVLLNSHIEVPAGWLSRLIAHAYAQRNIATVSPLSDATAIQGGPMASGETPVAIDEACRVVNVGRSADGPATMDHCVYIRRAALLAVGDVMQQDFCARATASGWQHRFACDTFIPAANPRPHAVAEAILPFQFAVTAALFRKSRLPVILMVSHYFGGGVRRHIDTLVDRYRDTMHVLMLEGTDRGATLSVPSLPDHPVLTLPSDRLDDLITILRSANVSRLHIHHLLQIDMDIRALIHRLGVPFDVTVHDYYAICPQVNLLRWPEGLYCGEPGPAACNTCIASQSSHGARDIVSWRRDRAWQFMDADRVICPSQDVKTRLDRHGLGQRAIVVLHEQQTETVWTTHLPAFSGEPLRVVLLGVLANQKGARAVAEVAEAVAPGTIELHLVGHLEPSFPKPAVKLIKATGKYRESDLPMLLERIDPHVLWLPSSTPESYSFTLSTAIATGLPIVATDFGSFTERLAGRPHTWLVDHRASSKDWLTVFDAVRTTLVQRVAQPSAARAVVVSDFYEDHYLSPAPRQASVRRSQRPKIAIVPERFGNGGLTPCAYIRLLQPLDHPAISRGFDVILADAETIFDYDIDIIVTQRHAISDVETADRLADHAHRTGAKLVFDLDDDLLSIPATHPDAETLRPLANAVRRMLTVSDTVWVSTPGLAERLASIRPDAVVIENRLDERIWIDGPAPAPFWDDPIRILCMGTATHDQDFAIIEPALARLKADYGDRIAVDILGMTNRSELPSGLNRIGPTTHGSRSYPGFVNWLTSNQPRWHIGLAPLLDTPFNRSKSSIKALDYAAMGLVVLASDTPVYRGSIADGPAGQLVPNDHRAWHAALDWLIRNQSLRETGAIRAYEAFLAQGTLAGQAVTRRAALTRLLPDGGQGIALRDAPSALTIPHGSTDPATRKRRHRGRGR